MDEYDPNQAPKPSEWLELDEGTRIVLVPDYHADANEALPNEQVHASIHVIVENQIATGVEPVPATMERLIGEGLDRHEAVHAI